MNTKKYHTKHGTLKSLLSRSICTTLLGLSASVGLAEIEDNLEYRHAFETWAAAHFSLLPTSFLPGLIGTGADVASIAIDIRIKTLPAVFVAPTPNAVVPASIDGCQHRFYLPQKSAQYENLFGLANINELNESWGSLSNDELPQVEHANAAVVVTADNEHLDSWTEGDRYVEFPSGNHPITWAAHTQIDPLIDVALPIAIFVASNEIKYLDAFFSIQTDPATAARAAEVGGLFLINAGIELGFISAGQIPSNLPRNSATHEQIRPFTVLDITPPEITTSQPFPDALEANSLGGERWDVHKDFFASTITATDPCDQPLLIGNDAPTLLPIGTTTITWEALDTGPIGGDNSGRATVTQSITVHDTRAPIILAPPSRVIESMNAATTDQFDIGNAVVFDVADPNPNISSTVPDDFPANSRTEIVWTATDSSGNTGSQSQWITVKTPGSNTAPSVNNIAETTLTSQPIDITLTGQDGDFISGRFDPLSFSITQRPSHGFFVAPLMPYFIEDYRVRPGTAVGNILNNASNPASELDDAFCRASPPQDIPIDFVYRSEFVHVDDEGIAYVLDEYWQCTNGLPVTRPRLSKWDADGNFLLQTDIEQSIKRITMDNDGFIYAVKPSSSSTALSITKYDEQLNNIQLWRLTDINDFGNPRLLGASIDSDSGLIFATDKRRVYIFDGADGTQQPERIGTLKNAENFLSGAPSVAGSSSRGFYIRIDSEGHLYVVDSGLDRIHKFAQTTYDGTNIKIGSHIGWMGRCETGPGCDDDNQRSFGYSCSDQTPCTVLIANGNNCGSQLAGECSHGSAQGQFDTPIGMALDDNDILYVTDYENSRVQRFTPLGDFAGVADSTCDGSCFVLGDMGRPLDISVNSEKFYVLDQDRDLMHVFETSPFKDITDDSVTLSYASNNDFQGTDTFHFIANDGLVNSNEGIASINVSRNFRAPESFDQSLSTSEDGSANLTLVATDPDGILGIDFNGLDELTYHIVTPPQYGSLSGAGADRIYEPNQDYNGPDAFSFLVNDGTFDSNIATVEILVNPVNDAPQVQITGEGSQIIPAQLLPLLKNKIVGDQMQAGLGYPLPLMAEFTDPDDQQAHFLQILWGDGNSDSANQDPPEDPDKPGDAPIITNTFQSLGQIVAEHTYLTSGFKNISVMVFDDQAASSNTAQATIEVIPMVDLILNEEQIEPEDFPAPGETTTFSIELINQAPTEPIVGLTATDVEFTGTLPEGVTLMGVSTTQGSCMHNENTSTCNIGTMVPNQTVTLTVSILPEILFNPSQAGYVIDVTSNEPDASFNNLKVIEIPIQFQDEIFSNGFD